MTVCTIIEQPVKSTLIDRHNPEINLSRQAELLEISRSVIYYRPIINQREISILNAIYVGYTKSYGVDLFVSI